MTEHQPAGSAYSDDPGPNESPASQEAADGGRVSSDADGSADSVGHDPASDAPVLAALARLDGLGERPLHEHPDVYQAIHADLQNALAAIDDA